MQYPLRLLHSIELSRFSNLLMPNSELCMCLIELSFRSIQCNAMQCSIQFNAKPVASKLWPNAIASP